ncbi:MAG: aminoacyl-tRNA hydrolase [Oscillospiraceae bacterium]|jgi:PTH1 family peptidyl-tRNA hydrolase|nr:aminoacyl-tRNA hydrolase [Oscillospiraceae bacterium]
MQLFHKPSAAGPQWLIAGLGNPGKEYEFTRHNAGFLAMDVLVNRQNVPLNKLKFGGLFAQGELGGVRCALLKPVTYMNESGRAVAECARFFKIPPERVLVLCDDISFAPGVLRIRRGGSAGGQNGLKSIIAHLGTQAFPRIRLGVGQKPHPDDDLVDWVLSPLRDGEREALRAACEDACAAAALIVDGALEEAMSRYSH